MPTARAEPPTIRDTLRRLFGVDLRALAALRIAIALVILVDLGGRLSTVQWFLCDDLFFTRPLSQQLTPWSQGFWSLYWWHGSSAWAGGLLALNAVAAVAVLVGWQTRWATLLCLILAWSLQVRMPLVLTAGHVLLRTLLVWMLLLPCDRVWSLAARGRPDPSCWRIASPATAGLLLQVVCLYLFAGIAKWNEIWLRGDAVYLAMQLDMYVKPWGRNLLQWPELCRVLTWGTLLLEVAGPWLLFMPFGTRSLRAVLCVAFYALHCGIWLAFSIGIFSAVALVAWIPFWPENWWERWGERWRCAPSCNPTGAPRAEREAPRGRTHTLPRTVAGLLATSVLVYTIAINVANIDPARSSAWFPAPLRRAGNLLMLTQEFRMFDRPSAWNYCWRLMRQDSAEVWYDEFSPPSRPCPAPQVWPAGPAIYAAFPNQLWRRLFFNLAYFGDTAGGPDPALRELRRRLGTAMFAAWPPGFSWEPRPATAAKADKKALICLRRSLQPLERDMEPSLEIWAEQ